MENTRPSDNECAKLTDQSLTDKKSLQRAQKRLATQSERDQMAELPTSPTAALPQNDESVGEN